MKRKKEIAAIICIIATIGCDRQSETKIASTSVPANATTILKSDGLSPAVEVNGSVCHRLNMADLIDYHGEPMYVISLQVTNTGASAIIYDSIAYTFSPRDGSGIWSRIEYLKEGDGTRTKTLASGKTESLEFTGSVFVRNKDRMVISRKEPVIFVMTFGRNGIAVSDRFTADLPSIEHLPLQSDLPNQSDRESKANNPVVQPLTFKRVVTR